MLKLWVLFCSLPQINLAFITVECQEKENISSWSCQDFEVKLANNKGENLPKTLSCMNYDKFAPPELPTQVFASMIVHKIKSFDIETQSLTLDIQEDWSWQDFRIIWPDQCRIGGLLAEIRYLSKEIFKSMWT